jgi:hypothetical protein
MFNMSHLITGLIRFVMGTLETVVGQKCCPQE